MDSRPSSPDAVGAALEVGRLAGFASTRPVVLQDSNNVVVWLAPHRVVAKVGVHPHSSEVLAREVELCHQLASIGAPVAVPIGLHHVGRAPCPVSLWERLDADPAVSPSDRDLAAMIRRVHDAMDECAVQLPTYLVSIDVTRAVLFDDERMRAVPSADLELLRGAFDRWADQAGGATTSDRPLHGEPHLGNVVVTREGPYLVDFEAASTGPLEWDLASLPPAVATAYGSSDGDLLLLLRRLNSARVAAWCWARADHPGMRAHAEHHLAVVRSEVT